MTPPGSLGSELVDAMVEAWHRGDRPPAEAFLDDHPGLDDESATRLIFEECCLRREVGLAVDEADLARRFPGLWPDLELLLDCQRIFGPIPTGGTLPESGDELAGFRLVAELGRGAAGRVFLASQLALADRPVVVKVTPLGRGEHLSLARLQHMNIVPLFSALSLPDRGLQVLCMPFLGGGSLAKVLGLLEGIDPARRTGAQLVEALDRAQEGLPVALPPRGPFRRHLARSTYVEAICWVGICLADGLQYAHERDFVHMDIKPSNVLIAGDGQPMLLDFHLAREPIAPGGPVPDALGGTPAYAAPEQAGAMAAVREGRAVPAPVDGRADLFALGLLLDEALGGAGPNPADGPRVPLRRRNPEVSVGLSDVIDKCLQVEPGGRYPDAASVAADLRRLLEGRPLRGVPNRSPLERWRAWRRRRPHALGRALALIGSASTAVAASSLLLAAYLQRVREVEAALADATACIARRQYPEATRSLRRGLALAAPLPASVAHREELRDGIARAEGLAKLEGLHRLAELVRFRHGVDPPAPAEAREMIGYIRMLWSDREALLKAAGGRVELDETVRDDLLGLALAWVGCLAVEPASGEALRVLDEAERLLGPNPAIARERRRFASAGEPDLASTDPTSTPRSAREHLELGASLLRAREFEAAAEQFRRGLDLRPEDFWLNFDQGLCAYQLGRFDESAAAFRVCIALAPDSAECYYNRALALGALGLAGKAIDDYTRALRRDPSLGPAWLNRGMLRYRAGRLAEAEADLRQALAATSSRPDRAIICYNQALVALAKGDRDGALRHLDAAIGLGDEDARSLRDRVNQ